MQIWVCILWELGEEKSPPLLQYNKHIKCVYELRVCVPVRTSDHSLYTDKQPCFLRSDAVFNNIKHAAKISSSVLTPEGPPPHHCVTFTLTRTLVCHADVMQLPWFLTSTSTRRKSAVLSPTPPPPTSLCDPPNHCVTLTLTRVLVYYAGAVMQLLWFPTSTSTRPIPAALS